MIVTANCRNSAPEIPAMNATGTKTDSNTNVTLHAVGPLNGKNDFPQLSLTARSGRAPTIDPIVCRLCGVP
jgi:hypothetical protein